MRLTVTGMGMVTSVGRTAAAACAAIRAGISRPRGMAYFTVLDDETQEPLTVTGHPVRGYTEGFTGAALWLRLAAGAVEDLLGSAGLPGAADTAFWRRTGLLAVTPTPGGDRFRMDSEEPALLEGALLRPLRARLGVSFDHRLVGLGGVEHAGTAQALSRAEALVQAGAERVLVVAVDSYLDSITLQWLGEADRLKTGDVPTGLVPGEAAVALLIESPASARRRGTRVLAELTALAVAREPNTLGSDAPNSGLGLATCVHQALDAASFPGAYAGDVFLDLNGETWRAQEWGMAQVRLGSRLGAPRLHLPGVHVGDTGAASGALGLALAVHFLHRGHTRDGNALVVSSSAEGAVACVALQAAPPPSARP